MDKENNEKIVEVSQMAENTPIGENVSAKENIEAVEIVKQEEIPTNSFIRRKKTTKLMKSIIPAAVVGVVSVSVIATSGLVNLTMNATINNLEYVDGVVKYDVTATDMSDSNNLYFEIYNDEMKLIEKYVIYEGIATDVKGSYELDLETIETELQSKDNLEYTFRLCGNTGLVDRTYDSWIVGIDDVGSEFKSVTYHCDCAVSGNFKFTMDFTDDYGYFTDFTASITDSAGVERKATLTDNLHEEQSIFVLDLDGGDAVFKITYKQQDELKTLTYDVKI